MKILVHFLLPCGGQFMDKILQHHELFGNLLFNGACGSGSGSGARCAIDTWQKGGVVRLELRIGWKKGHNITLFNKGWPFPRSNLLGPE